MDEAAKTETEDKASENTGDEPQIPADESESVSYTHLKKSAHASKGANDSSDK